MSRIDVCVVGELNLDLILYGLPKILDFNRELLASNMALTLGSSSAIFAHNLSALGTRVGFISTIGSDPLGQICLDRLQQGGVEVNQVRRATTGTQTGLTVLLPQPQNRYILTYPGTMFEMQFSDINLDYLREAGHFHLSSFFLLRALRPRIIDLFKEAKKAGLTTSLDTNDDPENQWGQDLMEVLKYVDVFLPNEREAKKIARTDDLSKAIDLLAAAAKVVVVKRGPAGALCRSGEQQFSLMPPAIEAVDDVGAGDSFAAGFIHRFVAGAKLEDCLAWANLAGAYSTTREGGTEAFRDRVALRAFVSKHGLNLSAV